MYVFFYVNSSYSSHLYSVFPLLVFEEKKKFYHQQKDCISAGIEDIVTSQRSGPVW